MADGDTLRLTHFGSVDIMILARGAEATVTLTEVYLEPRPKNERRFLLKAGKKDSLSCTTSTSALAGRSEGAVAFDVAINNNVLYIHRDDHQAEETQLWRRNHGYDRSSRRENDCSRGASSHASGLSPSIRLPCVLHNRAHGT